MNAGRPHPAETGRLVNLVSVFARLPPDDARQPSGSLAGAFSNHPSSAGPVPPAWLRGPWQPPAFDAVGFRRANALRPRHSQSAAAKRWRAGALAQLQVHLPSEDVVISFWLSATCKCGVFVRAQIAFCRYCIGGDVLVRHQGCRPHLTSYHQDHCPQRDDDFEPPARAPPR